MQPARKVRRSLPCRLFSLACAEHSCEIFFFSSGLSFGFAVLVVAGVAASAGAATGAAAGAAGTCASAPPVPMAKHRMVALITDFMTPSIGCWRGDYTRTKQEHKQKIATAACRAAILSAACRDQLPSGRRG